jgi:hypothetical protein
MWSAVYCRSLKTQKQKNRNNNVVKNTNWWNGNGNKTVNDDYQMPHWCKKKTHNFHSLFQNYYYDYDIIYKETSNHWSEYCKRVKIAKSETTNSSVILHYIYEKTWEAWGAKMWVEPRNLHLHWHLLHSSTAIPPPNQRGKWSAQLYHYNLHPWFPGYSMDIWRVTSCLRTYSITRSQFTIL